MSDDVVATPLTPYGIQTERSHYRAHVSVVNECIFLFATADAVLALERGRYQERFAGQQGVQGVTSRGFAVPCAHIKPLWTYRVDVGRLKGRREHEFTIPEKSANAVAIVLAFLLGKGIEAKEVKSRGVQLAGGDIVVREHLLIQVKMDWRSGPPPGTGNLFLQIAECNPLGHH